MDLPPTVEAVVVQPARLPPAAGEAAFSIVRLDGGALSSHPRVDEALTNVPGVSLFRRNSSLGANPATQGISLRAIAGSAASRALVTLDGVPQHDPFGGWVMWTSIPSEIVDGVRVVRGAGAGPYGAGAVTGTIELDERLAVAGSGGELSIGQRGYRRAALVAGGGGEATRFMLSASAESNDGWTAAEPERRGAADDPLALDALNVSAKLQTALGPSALAVRVGAYREKRSAGLVGAASRAEGWTGSVTLASAPTDVRLGWRVQAWVRRSDLYNSTVSVGAGRAGSTPANIQHATPALGYGFNAALRRAAPGHGWELGVDARVSDGETRELFRFQAPAFTRARVAGGRAFVGGAYAEASHTGGDLLLTAGIRLDRWRSSQAQRVEVDLLTGNVVLDQRPASRAGWVPTARVGAKLELDHALYWRSAAYAGFRPATLNELHRPFRVGNDVTEANAALRPERLFGVESGFGGTFLGAGAWSVGVFYNQLQDAIANVTIGEGPGTFAEAGFIPAGGVLRQKRNAGSVDAVGAEAAVEREIAPGLVIDAAASFTRARINGGTAAPRLTGLRPAQTPRFSALAGMRWSFLPRADARLDVRYESARFDDDLNSRMLPSAVMVDARTDWRLTGDATVYVAVDNLLDTEVATAVTGDGVRSFGQPRTFRFGVKIRR